MPVIMKMFAMRNMSRQLDGLRRLASRLTSDCRGFAAIEFAFIVPLMLVMFFGVVEITSGVAVDRKVTLVARTLSDLTSQSLVVADTDINNIFAIGDAVMAPFSPTPIVATITEIYVDPSSLLGKVIWSKGDAARASGSTMTLPVDLRTGGTYLILSEVRYLYTPSVGYVMGQAGVTLTDQTYTRPRQSKCVYYPSTPANQTCPTS